MNSRNQRLFQQAAAATRRRIQIDLERCSPDLRPILLFLSKNLFHRNFTLRQLQCHYPLTTKIRSLFLKELGLRPKQYVIARKFEAAAWLLRETKLKSWEVGHLLGYSRSSNFSRDFKRWCGLRPETFRGRQRVISGDRAQGHWGYVWRGLVGALSPTTGAAYLSQLEHHLTSLKGAGRKPVIRIRSSSHEEDLIGAIWQLICVQSIETQKLAVRHWVKFESPLFFEFLSRESKRIGRSNRDRGIELAELALLTLEANRDELGEVWPALYALGWARLGRRVFDDPERRQEAFRRADEALAMAPPTPVVQAEILFLKASVKIFQRCFEDALELLDRSIVLSRLSGNHSRLLEAIVQRASVLGYQGKIEALIPELLLARELIRDSDDDELLLQILQNLAMAYVVLGQYDKARKLLPAASGLAKKLDHGICCHQVEWIRALVYHGSGENREALEILRRARRGLKDSDQGGFAAAVTLELALLYYELGFSKRAVILAAEALSVFEALAVDRETIASLHLLRAAIDRELRGGRVLREAQDRARRAYFTLAPRADC